MSSKESEKEKEDAMIGNYESVLSLISHYQHADASAGFIPGIHYLNENFASMRSVRGDGNCFYRAFLYGYLDNLLYLHSSSSFAKDAEEERKRIVVLVKNSLKELVDMGYLEIAIESFHDVKIIFVS